MNMDFSGNGFKPDLELNDRSPAFIHLKKIGSNNGYIFVIAVPRETIKFFLVIQDKIRHRNLVRNKRQVYILVYLDSSTLASSSCCNNSRCFSSSSIEADGVLGAVLP